MVKLVSDYSSIVYRFYCPSVYSSVFVLLYQISFSSLILLIHTIHTSTQVSPSRDHLGIQFKFDGWNSSPHYTVIISSSVSRGSSNFCKYSALQKQKIFTLSMHRRQSLIQKWYVDHEWKLHSIWVLADGRRTKAAMSQTKTTKVMKLNLQISSVQSAVIQTCQKNVNRHRMLQSKLIMQSHRLITQAI